MSYTTNLNLARLRGWDLALTIAYLPRLTREDIIPLLPNMRWQPLEHVLADPRMKDYKYARPSKSQQ